MFRATLFWLTLIALANPSLADEVTQTLSSALQAYEDGDIEYAIEELEYARQLLKEMSSKELTAYLPEPPAGWTREIGDTQMNAGLAFLGGLITILFSLLADVLYQLADPRIRLGAER